MTTHRRRDHRRGFTLVEVLLALALTMLVLAATYASLILFQRVTLAGRADAERSQLARALERRITADIRCVLFREQSQETQTEDAPAAGLAAVDETVGAADDPGGTTEGAGSTGGTSADSTSTGGSTSSSGTTETTITTPTDAYATQSVGVFGDATTLVLHVSKPGPPSAMPAPMPVTTTFGTAPLVPRSCDLRSISYFLAVPGGAGLQGAVANTTTMTGVSTMNASSGGAPVVQAGQGLARLDGDRLAIQQADQSGGVDVLAQNATILAAEVTELRFRYFDGTAWVETWDSVALNAVPRAIEVTLRIDVDADEQQAVSFLDPGPPPAASDVYRFVVALPVADPTLGLAL